MVMRLWILPASLVGTLLPTLSRQNAIEEVDFATVLGRNRPELGFPHDFFLSIGTGLRSLRRVIMHSDLEWVFVTCGKTEYDPTHLLTRRQSRLPSAPWSR